MKKCVLASGTPMRNSPLDLWPHLRVWAGLRMDREAFQDRYCITDWKTLPNGIDVQVIQGGQNIEELLRRLSGLFRKRQREDVVGELPALHVFAHPMPASGAARQHL